jgi:hypothetical protein
VFCECEAYRFIAPPSIGVMGVGSPFIISNNGTPFARDLAALLAVRGIFEALPSRSRLDKLLPQLTREEIEKLRR